MREALRSGFRCLVLLGLLGGTLIDWFLSVLLTGRSGSRSARARLMQRWARRIARLIGCRITVVGRPPERGLCVSNHLSYVDIPVFGSVTPMVFVSKHEVRYWPLFGQCATVSGTLFIKRERKGDVADVGAQMAEVLEAELPLVVFPEGTSSDGKGVLPFKSSLFQPAVDRGWSVTPMHIRYEAEDGEPAEEVPYWGEMTLFPHLVRLCRTKSCRAVVSFGEPIEPGTDRKQLCQRAYAAVVELSRASGGTA